MVIRVRKHEAKRFDNLGLCLGGENVLQQNVKKAITNGLVNRSTYVTTFSSEG